MSRIAPGDFSVPRRFGKPFVSFALSGTLSGNPALFHRNQFTMSSAQLSEVLRWRALSLGRAHFAP